MTAHAATDFCILGPGGCTASLNRWVFFLFRFGFVCLFVFEFVCVKLCCTLKQVMVVNATCLASHMTVSKVRAAF